MENSKKSYILSIYSSKNTVFTVKDIALIWNETSMEIVRRRLYRYAKAGKLYAIRKGLYAKDKNYNKFELATKIFTPSYISLETVLARAGVVFQFYNQIFVASYLTREIVANGQKFSYKKIKDTVLTNRAGVETKDNYHIASPERAFLDIVYSRKGYHFDNLSPLNWDRVFEILPIYKNKAMEKRVKRYHKSVNKSK
jgi:predicted transcriptional regulator of viral defense system